MHAAAKNPARTAAAVPATPHPLRQHRESHGWSQDEVAKHLVLLGYKEGENLGVSAAMVGRWERGERRPRPPYPRLLCLLFGATATELGLAPSPYRLPSDTMDEVERRKLLRLLASAAAAPVLARGKASAGSPSRSADADRLAHALQKPSKADETVASVVEASVLDARRLDDVLGSRIAVEPALAQRKVVQTLLKNGPSDAAIRHRLTIAGGELSQFLAWLSFGMNDEPTCLRYLDEALGTAHEADAHDLVAYVMGQRSEVATALGRPQQGLAYAEAATSWAEARGSQGTRSWLAAREAGALAKLGDRGGTEHALDRARKALVRSKPEDEPSWLYFWDAAGVDYWIGTAYLTLGLAEPTRQAMRQASAKLDDSMVRDQAWCLAHLSETYVLDREVHEACRLATQALAIAGRTRCDRVVLYVRELRAKLGPWRSEAVVRDLDDQLANTSAWCQPVNA